MCCGNGKLQGHGLLTWRCLFSQVMNAAINKYKHGPGNVTVHSHALPFTNYESVFLSAISTFLIAIAIIIAFAFISAFYGFFLVAERENSAKHQQVRDLSRLCVCVVAPTFACRSLAKVVLFCTLSDDRPPSVLPTVVMMLTTEWCGVIRLPLVNSSCPE